MIHKGTIMVSRLACCLVRRSVHQIAMGTLKLHWGLNIVKAKIVFVMKQIPGVIACITIATPPPQSVIWLVLRFILPPPSASGAARALSLISRLSPRLSLKFDYIAPKQIFGLAPRGNRDSPLLAHLVAKDSVGTALISIYCL